MTDKAASGWEEYFVKGETLLWEGAPQRRFRPTWATISLAVFGMPFLMAGLGVSGAALLGFVGGGDALSTTFVFFFGLPFAGAGIGMTILPIYATLFAHKYVRYAISTRRAYIATRWWGRKIVSHEIGRNPMIELMGNHTIRFHSGSDTDSDGIRTPTVVSFDNIANASKVYSLLRELQMSTSADPRDE